MLIYHTILCGIHSVVNYNWVWGLKISLFRNKSCVLKWVVTSGLWFSESGIDNFRHGLKYEKRCKIELVSSEN